MVIFWRSIQFFLIPLSFLFAQTQDLKFQNITIENGSLQEPVLQVVQDHKGFIWFGTIDGGLKKYDGYEITVYKNNPEDTTTINANHISVLFVDRNGRLWIGTQNHGLCRYNHENDSFIRYYSRTNDSTTLSNPGIESIFECLHFFPAPRQLGCIAQEFGHVRIPLQGEIIPCIE